LPEPAIVVIVPLPEPPNAPVATTAATATTTLIARNHMSPPCLEPGRASHDRQHQAPTTRQQRVVPSGNQGPTRVTPLLLIRKPFPAALPPITVHVMPFVSDRQ